VGIVDTLSAGLNRISKRWRLLLIPLVIDIVIWIGPRLSLNQLSQTTLGAFTSLSELGQEYQQAIEPLHQTLMSLGAQSDLLPLLSMELLGIPSLTGTFPPEARLLRTARAVIEVPTWFRASLLALSLTLFSLLIGCFFLAWVAQEAREEEPSLRHVLQVTGRSFVQLLALLLLVSLAVLGLGMGVLLAYSIVTALIPQLGSVLFSIFAIAAVWLSLYVGIVFYFIPRALILDDAGIAHAVWSSLHVVHRGFFSAAIFVLLVNVIQTGLMYIWQLLGNSAAGTLLGIAASAYVTTGLALASLLFYRDRFVAWQEARAVAKTGEK